MNPGCPLFVVGFRPLWREYAPHPFKRTGVCLFKSLWLKYELRWFHCAVHCVHTKWVCTLPMVSFPAPFKPAPKRAPSKNDAEGYGSKLNYRSGLPHGFGHFRNCLSRKHHWSSVNMSLDNPWNGPSRAFGRSTCVAWPRKTGGEGHPRPGVGWEVPLPFGLLKRLGVRRRHFVISSNLPQQSGS